MASTSSWSSLEPVSSTLPQELFTLSGQEPRLINHNLACNAASAHCYSLGKTPECPKHGIRHNPCLALPKREGRSLSSSSTSSTKSTSSVKSLKRFLSHL
ncbi:hypothetical protein OIO90_003325 [Microbotryomycetes sp. JL221]|nr:hypothetical protein OIO90_003325 [Microbotryomycetes sp. JL221]